MDLDQDQHALWFSLSLYGYYTKWSTVVLVDSQIRILVRVRKKKIEKKIQRVGVP